MAIDSSHSFTSLRACPDGLCCVGELVRQAGRHVIRPVSLLRAATAICYAYYTILGAVAIADGGHEHMLPRVLPLPLLLPFTIHHAPFTATHGIVWLGEWQQRYIAQLRTTTSKTAPCTHHRAP